MKYYCATQNRLTHLNLKQNLKTLADRCKSDEDIIELKSHTSSGIRDVMDSIHECIIAYRERISISVDKYINELFSTQRRSNLTSISLSSRDLIRSHEIDLDTFSNKDVSETDLSTFGTSFVAGGAMGYAGAMLFGPIGIAVAVVGAGLLRKKLEENRMNREWEKIRIQTLSNIKNQINMLLTDNNKNAIKIAEQEGKRIGIVIRERFESRLSTIRNTIDSTRIRILAKGKDLELEKQSYLKSIEDLQKLLAEIKCIQEEMLLSN